MTATKYAVRCDDYRTDPSKTRESAEHQLELIEKAGNCQLAHEVVEVVDG